MSTFRAADHAMGLELQLEELIEQRQRAVTQHRDGDAAALGREIADLQTELALTAEVLASEPPAEEPAPVYHDRKEHEVGGEE
jgi:hypothetical protein